MRTTIYVDGYNLFYGCLKHTAYKWLDLRELLFNKIVRVQAPESELVQIRFYTADIKTKFATRGNQARTAQDHYHNALKAHLQNEIEIVKGYYATEKAPAIAYEQPPDKQHRVWIWRLEEKQTDVNIAIDGYRDASKGLIDQAVFVSNDADLEPALKAMREDFGDDISIGLITPVKARTGRTGSGSLDHQSDWTRRYIRDEELSQSQLERVIHRQGKKPIIKPDYW